MYNLYQNTYFAFNPNLEQNPQLPPSIQTLADTYNIYSQPNDTINGTEEMKIKLAQHAYNNSKHTEETESTSLAVVKTVKAKISPPVYYFGDPLGFLSWKNRCRTFETLEASIIFDAEEEGGYMEESEKIHSDTNNQEKEDVSSRDSEGKEISHSIPDVNILKDKRKGFTKEDIVNIYCNLQDIKKLGQKHD